jgi:hypothetical protein
MDRLFPAFNTEEKFVVESLGEAAERQTADHLREITRHLES